MNAVSPEPPRMGRKAFQEATVRHAVERLCDPQGSRRFLVADEVGLGKTLVAQGILQHLATGPRPLNVFYICSSLTIASQNRDSLLEILPAAQRACATVEVDRPTLLPWAAPPTSNRFALFTLTPGTLPRKGSSRGRVDERAAIWCLLREGLAEAGSRLGDLEQRLRLVQQSTWDHAVGQRSNGSMLESLRALATPFVQEVRATLRLHDSGDRAVVGALLGRLEGDGHAEIKRLRQILGRLGLQRLRPDLVILDEFQRFFEILEPFRGNAGSGAELVEEPHDEPDDDDHDAHGLLKLLLGARGREPGPAILLLSATPYRPPAGIEGPGLGHYDQFFKLLEFLYGTEAGVEVPTLKHAFKRYGALLREAAPGDAEALSLRDLLQARLSRVIARTERAGLLGSMVQAGAPQRRQTDLRADDIRIFQHLWDAAGDADRSAVAPYWSSIPYPLQMMDQRYLLRKRAMPAKLDDARSSLLLRERQVRRYEEIAVPHPRMRALLADIRDPSSDLPWLPPTLPWWPLGAPFATAAAAAAEAGVSKTLLFSRFRAVPRAIASLLSYESERCVYAEGRADGRKYDYHARKRGGREVDVAAEPDLEPLPAASFNWQARQRDDGDRDLSHTVLSLFMPAPLLGEIGDPQRRSGFASGKLKRSDAIEEVTQELRQRLGTSVQVRDGARTGQAWRAFVRLEHAHAATWPLLQQALAGWARQARNRNAAATVSAWLREAERAASLFHDHVTINHDELDELAELALVGPGIVLQRAARRVFEISDAKERLRRCVDIALGPLRTYLDEPEFHVSLGVRERAVPNHPEAIRRAIWHGNFESVLDEYFAVHAGLGAQVSDPGRQGKALDAIEEALGIRASSIRVQSLEGGAVLSLRCHTAMPFGLTPEKDQARDVDAPDARPDALRLAFNSPFRLFALATTSIGQEGLDFHVYCDRLVHWDLPASPVDLEQRDGRINRYGGLAIRKVLARDHRESGQALPTNGSPWLVMTRALPETCEGMAPWWGVHGASIRRVVLLPPLAKQERELERLLSGLSHYRLALGQSDPAQLLRALQRKVAGAGSAEDRERLLAWLQEVRIDLAPVRRQSGP